MYIDNWDIREANGRQFNVVMGHQVVDSRAEWISGGLAPAPLSVAYGLKPLTVTVLVYGDSRGAAHEGVSEVLGRLVGPVDLCLDGFDTIYHGTLKSHSVTEPKRIPGWTGWRRFLQLTMIFDGYEHGEDIVVERTGAGQVQVIELANPGTGQTPAHIMVSCSEKTRPQLVIEGLGGGTVTIPRRLPAETFDLDGETGIMQAVDSVGIRSVLDAGAELWELPYITPGKNVITVTGAGAGATVRITYKPRYI